MDQYPTNPVGLGGQPTVPIEVLDDKSNSSGSPILNNGTRFKFAKFRRLAAPWLAIMVLAIGLVAGYKALQAPQDLRQQASGSDPVNINLVESTTTMEPGQTQVIDVIADTDTTGNPSDLSAVELHITSDNPGVVKFVSAQLTNVLPQELPEGGGIVVSDGQIDITAGVKCTESSTVGCGALAGNDLIIATITVQAIAQGQARIHIDNSSNVAIIGQVDNAMSNTTGASDITVENPDVEVHMECQNEACVEVQGAGENQCLISAECVSNPNTLIVCPLNSADPSCDFFGSDGLKTAINQAPNNASIIITEGEFTNTNLNIGIDSYGDKLGLKISGDGGEVKLIGIEGYFIFDIGGSSTVSITGISLGNGYSGLRVRQDAKVNLTNVLMFQNYYGVLIKNNGQVSLDKVTISQSGYRGLEIFDNGRVSVKNSIAAFNDNGGFRAVEPLINFELAEYNLGFSNGDSGTWNQGFANWPPASNIEADPQFTDLAGGDYTPLPGSPACDGGENGTYIGAIPCDGSGSNTPGDANGDGIVNAIDYSILHSTYLQNPLLDSRADFNGDGAVNAIDYSILFNNYGAGLPN